MDHLSLYCDIAYALWALVFLVFGIQWVNDEDCCWSSIWVEELVRKEFFFFFFLEFNPIMPVVDMVERGIIILLKMRKLSWFIRIWFSLGCCLNSLVFIHSIVDSIDFPSVLVVILNFCILYAVLFNHTIILCTHVMNIH